MVVQRSGAAAVGTIVVGIPTIVVSLKAIRVVTRLGLIVDRVNALGTIRLSDGRRLATPTYNKTQNVLEWPRPRRAGWNC